MSSDAALLSKIFALTRGDLDNATALLPDTMSIFREYSLVRLRRLAAFWLEPGTAPDALTQSTARLLAGIHAQGSPVTFIFAGQERNLEVWVGTPQVLMSKADVSSLLHSAFPDCRTDEGNEFPAIRLPRLKYATLLTGTPTVSALAQSVVQDHIEYLVRGLLGRNWMFLVSGQPLAVPNVVRSINETANEITAVRSTFMLRQSPVDEQNCLAQRYVDLLEAKLNRLEAGRIGGMWQADRIFLAEDPSTLMLARGLLQSAFSGEKSLPDPIRIIECSPACKQMPVQEAITTAEFSAF